MPKVYVRDGEDLESALRRFKRQVNDAQILKECKKREFFMSKAEKRREKSKEAKLKARKAARKGF